MAASSRRKGVKGEREVAAIFRDAGWDVRGLESLGDWICLYGSEHTFHLEVKRQERLQLPMWLRQAADEAPRGAVPVVAFRQNQGEWYGVLPLAFLAELVA